jgi:SAM-dependent methyltransferase
MSDRHRDVHRSVADYYASKVRTHGANHCGVDWNSRESQELRFEQLLKIIDGPGQFTLNDLGCGYGALARYLFDTGRSFKYHGVDLAEPMLEEARSLFASKTNCSFSSDAFALPGADYTVASGVFSVRLQFDEERWRDYVVETIDVLARSSSRGFAFNMLTAYSDANKMRPDLYYADPHEFFDHCRTRYSRRVALLHDYELFEFTLLVRL